MMLDLARFPAKKGTYVLILRLTHPARLTVGKRGTVDFTAGDYAYVGSAFGGGGLRGRLKHHLSPVVRPHWHIDYLRAAATVTEVWYCADTAVHEHDWAAALALLPAATLPPMRFGASDCRCASHLVQFRAMPPFEQVCAGLSGMLQRVVR